MSPRGKFAALALAVGALGGGCATGPAYEHEMAAARAALERDDAPRARAALEGRLAEATVRGPEAALLRLELATVALHERDWTGAAAALALADPQLEVIDLSRDDHGEVASWLFSDAARPYRAPTWEKLMVNVLGMASRLAAGDLRGARVEARRFEVIARFFEDAARDPGHVAPVGQLLAAVALASVGRDRAAARYAERARAALPELYEAGEVADAELGEVIVVLLDGSAPHKVARTVSLGEAERIAAQPGAAARLRELGARDVTLVSLTPARDALSPPRVSVGDAVGALVWADLEATIRAQFAHAEASLARAALARALSRQTVERTLASVDRRTEGAKGPGFGMVLGGALARSMRATDTPDTRSWTTLPARLGVSRLAVPFGPARVTVADGEREMTFEVEVRPGAPAVVLVVTGRPTR